MQYRNPLFYLLTQVVGITALLGWLGYQIGYAGFGAEMTQVFHTSAAPQPYFSLESVGYLVAWVVLFGLYFSGWAFNRARLRWWGLAFAVLAGAFALLSCLYLRQGVHVLSQAIWAAAVAWLLCSLVFYSLIVTRHREILADISGYTLGEIWVHLAEVQVRRRKTLTAYGVLFVCLLPFLSSTWPDSSWMHGAVE